MNTDSKYNAATTALYAIYKTDWFPVDNYSISAIAAAYGIGAVELCEKVYELNKELMDYKEVKKVYELNKELMDYKEVNIVPSYRFLTPVEIAQRRMNNENL